MVVAGAMSAYPPAIEHDQRGEVLRSVAQVWSIRVQHLATPAICAAASAAGAALWPATRMWMSPPIFCAAAMAFNVAPLIELWSCSAMT